MLHDIHPHQFSNQYIPLAAVMPDDYLLQYKENTLLLKGANEVFAIPQRKDFASLPESTNPHFLFAFNGQNCFMVNDVPEPSDEMFAYHEISFLRGILQKEIAWVGSVGQQLHGWHAQNRFCGKCGAPTLPKADERAIQCTQCGHLVFPKISPAIIVAIRCNDKILLARNVNFRNGIYSLVAGYADIGESLEQTVAREVMEEVGVEVTNIRYYKSQPWPFSGSMMIAFIADANDQQPIRIDNKEIDAADWFRRGELPNRPNPNSIAGEMLELFEKGLL